MRIFTILLLAGALLASLTPAREARAQADWSVERDPFDQRLVSRYKRILAKNPADERALVKLVTLYQRHRSLDQLVEEYEAALAKQPAFSEAMVLGHLYLRRGDSTRALELYERAAKLHPGDPHVHIARGELYRRGGDDDAARAAFDQALPLATSKDDRRQILQVLADLALADEDIDAARRYYGQAIALEPKNLQTRIALADALSHHERHAEAIEILEQAEARLKTDPARRVEVIARIGAAREAMGEDDAAIREYRRAMAMTNRGYFLRRELTERVIEIHRRRQDLPALVTRYEKEWPAARRDHMEWDVLARLYEETGNQEAAIDAYRKAVRQAPYELDTQRRLISLLENSGRDADALRQYEAVIRVAPGEPRFQLELAQRYWRAAEPQKALALLAKIEKRFSYDAGVQMAVANLYAEWGEEQQALQVFVRLPKIEPDEIEHLVTLGEQYFQRGDKEKAIATWKKIAAKKTPGSFARLGDVYAEHDMPDEAIAMYTRAIKGEPKNPERYRGRARVYERKRLYSRAVEDWKQALALTSDKPSEQPARREARRRIVALLAKSGGALAREKIAWTEKFRADPPDLEAAYLLVEAHLKQDDPQRAEQMLERILELQPEDKEAMQLLVKVFREQEKYEAAIARLERLAELSPGREREFYNEIAELKRLGQKHAEAILYAEKALEKSPTDPLAHLQLAELYQKMQEVDKAIEAYKRTLELDPRNFTVHFALAALYQRTTAYADAAALYRDVLRNATDEQMLSRAGDAAIALEEHEGTLGELERVVAPLAFTYTHKPIYRSILVELYDHYVPQLVRQTRSRDPSEAQAARDELARLGKHGLKPLLEALADEENARQRRIAVSVLGRIGNQGAAVPLVKLAHEPRQTRRRIGTLDATEDIEMRTEALVAAGRLRDPRIIADLVDLLDHGEVALREAAAFALGMTGDRKAAAPLARALSDRRDSVQVAACFALAQLGEKTAREPLQAVVSRRDGDELPRAACAFALGYLGDPAAVPTLLEALGDGNDAAARMAAWSLGRLGARSAVPALLRAYFAKGPHVREAIAWALPRAAAGAAGNEPVHGLSEFPMKQHYDAADAVATMIGPLEPAPVPLPIIAAHQAEIADGARAALGSRNASVILRALSDLDARDRGLALGALTAELDAAPRNLRAHADAALASIAAAIVPSLEALVEHEDSEVRRRTVSVAAKTELAAAEPIVLASLRDRRPEVRDAAMAAAAYYAGATGRGGDALSAPIIAAMASGEWAERKSAAAALGSFGRHAPTAALVAALRDETGFVREAAARSLGTLRRKDAVDALIAATRDELQDVQLAAVEALAAIGGQAARARLAQIAADPRAPASVRRAAGSN